MTRNETVILSEEQLRVLLAEAAEAGAKKALEAVGLHDQDAANDVRDLRGVLEAFRAAKKTVFATVLRAITMAVMAAIIAGMGLTLMNRR